MNKKIYIKTFGCQMNLRDSEHAMGLLLDSGFKQASNIDEADVILFNSCSVRSHAEDRLFSNIADLKRDKEKRPGLVVGLMGCTAQNYKEKMLERLPMLDIVCGPGNESDLPRMIKDILDDRSRVVAVDKIDEKRPELFPEYRANKFKAFVSIGAGCDNFCSYCVVPYVRGREHSRDAKDIIKEIKDLAARGFKEVTLLGQNVNSYGLTTNDQQLTTNDQRLTTNFVQLLESLNAIKTLERIRFMTSHPKDASVELFKAMHSLDKVCEHLHLPFQSGSDRILKMMNRKYTHAKYIKLVEEYKKLVPDGSITTDVIVGFPSETDEDFNETVKLMKEVAFDGAFTFKYSPRPPAKAAELADDVTDKIKQERLEALMELQREISRKRNEEICGKILEVLVDGPSDRQPSLLCGRTRTNKNAIFEGPKKLIGKVIKVKVESVKPHTLIGRMA
jgi:tRNA-2-methylthio-N6-dimethylallyladenosine synthase